MNTTKEWIEELRNNIPNPWIPYIPNYSDDPTDYWDRKEKMAGRQRPQNCELCGSDNGGKSMHFDHDHAVSEKQNSNSFRGWICLRCNLILGLAHDDIDYLFKLVAYLNPEWDPWSESESELESEPEGKWIPLGYISGPFSLYDPNSQ